MNFTEHSPSIPSTKPRTWTAALTLVVLAPLVGEVLSGATRISYIFAFIPEMMVWGCGALMIRELVRRWGGGWTSMLIFGLALSVAEEFVIQQTSLAPLPWPATSATYGRLWGINWIYFLFMLGYECVWVVLVPVQLAELIFPKQRNKPWLGNVGLVISSAIFLFGSYIAWFAWIKRARPIVFHAPNYTPPRATILTGIFIIALLALTAYATRQIGQQQISSRSSPPAWTMILAAIVFASPWYWLMGLIFGGKSTLPFWLPLALEIIWATIAYSVIRYWSSMPAWNDMHRWALTFGATLVTIATGFSGSSAWPQEDLVGKIVFNILAVVGLLFMARRIGRRSQRDSLTPA
ncbi:MAG TPA: hypothetical protein VNU92_07540 [Edaphobacter sp.]|jgi:hypothetical protein|nr:hypothetical protein [Edaphobacter sp.]